MNGTIIMLGCNAEPGLLCPIWFITCHSHIHIWGNICIVTSKYHLKMIIIMDTIFPWVPMTKKAWHCINSLFRPRKQRFTWPPWGPPGANGTMFAQWILLSMDLNDKGIWTTCVGPLWAEQIHVYRWRSLSSCIVSVNQMQCGAVMIR